MLRNVGIGSPAASKNYSLKCINSSVTQCRSREHFLLTLIWSIRKLILAVMNFLIGLKALLNAVSTSTLVDNGVVSKYLG